MGLNQRPEDADTFSMGAASLRKASNDLKFDRSDLGAADTLRFNVLTFVIEENYERAIQELDKFLNKESEFPKFKVRVERYIHHATDLVNAIRAKRKFPGAQLLTMAKQQELNEKFFNHFTELQLVLKKIEHIQRDVRIEDVRSTVWIVKAAIHSVIAIAVVAFLVDINNGLMHTTMVVMDDVFREITSWIFSKF